LAAGMAAGSGTPEQARLVGQIKSNVTLIIYSLFRNKCSQAHNKQT